MYVCIHAYLYLAEYLYLVNLYIWCTYAYLYLVAMCVYTHTYIWWQVDLRALYRQSYMRFVAYICVYVHIYTDGKKKTTGKAICDFWRISVCMYTYTYTL